MFRRFLLLLSCAVCAPSLPASGQDNNGAKALAYTDAWQFVMSGMKSERAKLRSGVCEMAGDYFDFTSQEPIEGPIRGLIALHDGKLRFDIERPGWVADRDTLQAEGESGRVTALTKVGVLTTQFAYDGSRVASWNSNDDAAVLSRSGADNRPSADFFDIRAITLYDPMSLTRSHSLDEQYGYLETNFRNSRGEVDTEGSLWTVTRYADAAGVRVRLTVDTATAFTPVSFRCESAHPDGGGTWRPHWETSTRWKEVHGVWVPVHHTWHIAEELSGKPLRGWSADLSWQKVNESVDDRLFTYHDFALPSQVGVLDHSNDELTWEREIPARGRGSGAWLQSRSYALIVMFVGVAGLAIGWIVMRKRQ